MLSLGSLLFAVWSLGAFTNADLGPRVTALASPLVAQVNEWQDDWPTFFTRHRLQAQLDLIEKDYADRETQELWSRLQVGTALTSLGRDVSYKPATCMWEPLRTESEPGELTLRVGPSSGGFSPHLPACRREEGCLDECLKDFPHLTSPSAKDPTYHP